MVKLTVENSEAVLWIHHIRELEVTYEPCEARDKKIQEFVERASHFVNQQEFDEIKHNIDNGLLFITPIKHK